MSEDILEELRDIGVEKGSEKLMECFSDEDLIEFGEHFEIRHNLDECQVADLVRAYAECFGEHYVTDLESIKNCFYSNNGISTIVCEFLLSAGIPQRFIQYVDFGKVFEKELSDDYLEYDEWVFRNI